MSLGFPDASADPPVTERLFHDVTGVALIVSASPGAAEHKPKTDSANANITTMRLFLYIRQPSFQYIAQRGNTALLLPNCE